MKYRAVDSFYSSETKQLAGGQEFDPDDFGLSADRVKQMVEKGLIAPVTEGGAEPGSEETGAGGSEEPIDLSKLTRAELDELAAGRGVDVTEAKNKGEVIELLQKAEAALKNKAEPGAPSNKQA